MAYKPMSQACRTAARGPQWLSRDDHCGGHSRDHHSDQPRPQFFRGIGKAARGAGRPTDKIRLFDAFLVYGQMKLQPKELNAETRYWLIGEQIGKSDSTSLKGWIRQRDVVIWPSRLAVQWNEDATVSGYRTPDNLNRKEGQMTLSRAY
jgi:hypothetical protein